MNPRLLLDHAGRLVGDGPGRPRQADLRRAVSGAYYAVFHLLTKAAASRVASSPDLQVMVARTIDHRHLKETSRNFASPSLGKQFPQVATSVPADLRDVARAVVQLQEARHSADYDMDPGAALTRQIARTHVRLARDAFDAWDRVRLDPVAEVYLVALLVKLGR